MHCMHDQCTGKCLVQAGQKKETILLSQDIPIWATSYVTAAQENLQVEAEKSYYLLRFQMVKNQLDFSEVSTIKRGTYHNN